LIEAEVSELIGAEHGERSEAGDPEDPPGQVDEMFRVRL